MITTLVLPSKCQHYLCSLPNKGVKIVYSGIFPILKSKRVRKTSTRSTASARVIMPEADPVHNSTTFHVA
jgi:hypothetical protein